MSLIMEHLASCSLSVQFVQHTSPNSTYRLLEQVLNWRSGESEVTIRMEDVFFFGRCCARHNDSGSHEDMLKWSSVDNSIEQVGQWSRRKQRNTIRMEDAIVDPPIQPCSWNTAAGSSLRWHKEIRSMLNLALVCKVHISI